MVSDDIDDNNIDDNNIDDNNIHVEMMSDAFFEFCSEHIFPKFSHEFYSISCSTFLHEINQNRFEDENAKLFKRKIELLLSDNIVMIPLCSNLHHVLLFKVGSDCYFIDSLNVDVKSYPLIIKTYNIIKELNLDKNNKQISLTQINVETQTDGCTCGYRVFIYMLLIYSINPFNPDILKKVQFKLDTFKKLESVMKSFKEFQKEVLVPSHSSLSKSHKELIKEFSNKSYFEILQILHSVIDSL